MSCSGCDNKGKDYALCVSCCSKNGHMFEKYRENLDWEELERRLQQKIQEFLTRYGIQQYQEQQK